MRVATNTVSDTIMRQVQTLSLKQSKLQSQISSGQRITLPEDDPAAFSRVSNLQGESRRLAQYSENAGTALDLAQTSYTGLKSLNATAVRANEITALAGGVLNASDMAAYAEEVNQLVEQALQVGNTTFNGDYLYSGTATDTEPFTATRVGGKVTSVAYAGNSAALAVPLSDSNAVNPATSGTANTGIRDFINQLVALRDALNSGNSAGVSATVSGLDASQDNIIAAIGQNGGIQARIEAFQQAQTDRVTNVKSLIADASSLDISSAVIELSQTQTAYEAALKSASTILQTSLLDYIK